MSLRRLRTIGSLYFTYRDVADLLKITPQSAVVACSRYVRSGDLIRLKRNCYILREKWKGLKEDQLFVLANLEFPKTPGAPRLRRRDHAPALP